MLDIAMITPYTPCAGGFQTLRGAVRAMARDKKVIVAVSSGEWLRLEAAAAAWGISLNAWVRYVEVHAADGSQLPAAAPPPLSPPQPGAKLARAVWSMITEEEFDALREHARACGMTVSAF